MTSDNIQELILKARDGDMNAYQKCIQMYNSRVHAIAFQMVGSSADAQDIAQDVFIRIYRSLHTYKTKYSFSAWLIRMTVNLSIDHLRKQTRHKGVPLSEDKTTSSVQAEPSFPEAQYEKSQLKGAIHRISQGLTEKQRKVFVLRDLQGFSTVEIAQILKCRESTVRVHLSKARKFIKKELEDQGIYNSLDLNQRRGK